MATPPPYWVAGGAGVLAGKGGRINGYSPPALILLGDGGGGGGGDPLIGHGCSPPDIISFHLSLIPANSRIEFKIHYLHCSLRKIFFFLGSGLFLHDSLISRRLRVQDGRRPFAGTRRRPWCTQQSLHLYTMPRVYDMKSWREQCKSIYR